METRRVLVTGANRGLGRELVKLLAQKHPSLNIYATSRKDPQHFSQELQTHVPSSNISCYKLDINDNTCIQHVVNDFQSKGWQLDRIVANAGVGFDFGLKMPTLDMAQRFTQTNFLSTIEFIKQSLPLLNSLGRVVVVSAIFATLQKQPEPMRKRLTNPNVTQEELISIAREYVEAVRSKDMRDFSLGAYGTSKALLNSWIRFILPKHLKNGQSAIAMHPGWCQTDMGGPRAPMTALQGAESIYDCLVLKQVEADKFYNKKFCSYETCQ